MKRQNVIITQNTPNSPSIALNQTGDKPRLLHFHLPQHLLNNLADLPNYAGNVPHPQLHLLGIVFIDLEYGLRLHRNHLRWDQHCRSAAFSRYPVTQLNNHARKLALIQFHLTTSLWPAHVALLMRPVTRIAIIAVAQCTAANRKISIQLHCSQLPAGQNNRPLHDLPRVTHQPTEGSRASETECETSDPDPITKLAYTRNPTVSHRISAVRISEPGQCYSANHRGTENRAPR